MRIQGSQVHLASRRAYTESYARREVLQIQTARASPQPERGRSGDSLELSPQARARMTDPEKMDQPLTSEDQLKILILRKLLGIVVRLPAELPQAQSLPAASEGAPSPTASPAPAEPPPSWGMAYDLHERYTESESLTVSARGVVQTADGREIKFEIEAAISRTFVAEHHLAVRAGSARLVDPLVINFGDALASLTDRRYRFDLNADGTIDEIPFVGPGSGLLALDRNSDGMIGDGTELFGPATGNGFAELAGFDADGNGWIDEADPIWTSLKLWVKDGNGDDQLLSLAGSQVGALLLGNVDAGFTYKSLANQTQGEQQRAGVFLREDGTVGTVQQINLAT